MSLRLLILLFTLFGSFNDLVAQKEAKTLSRPNVLLIMVDDLRPELACYGKEHMVTPNIDRLAATGQLFTRAYANYPLCGPSRATLLSGIYPSVNRFNVWNCSQDEEVNGVVSLPMHFKNNNYQTISYGKIYNNLEDGKGSWDEIWRPVKIGDEPLTWEYLSREGREIFRKQNEGREKDLRPKNSNNIPKMGPAFESADVEDEAYADGKIATKTIEKLQELRMNPAQPFFLSVGFHKPHSPFNAPKQYWDLYDPSHIPLASNPTPAAGIPEHMKVDQAGVRSYYGVPRQGPISDSLARQLRHGYFACVSYIDRQVGKILNALEYYGMAENTIVVFVGDQGHQLGEHGLWDKVKSYSTSLQVPLIIRVPGKPKKVRQDELISMVDLYPTLCDLSGLRKPFHLQGTSAAAVINNPELKQREEVYCRSNLNAETIYTRTHSYTEFFDKDGKRTDRVLFDLVNDPSENVNVVDKPENRALVASLSEKLAQQMQSREFISLSKPKSKK